MSCNTVVIISNFPERRGSLEALVVQAGLDVETANSLEVWLQVAGPESASCVVLDMAEGDLGGPDQRAMFAAACSSHPILVLADAVDVPAAVQAMRHGAADVIQKPVEHLTILERIKRIIATAP